MNPRISSRISVNAVCFPQGSIADDMAAWRTLGVQTVALHVRKLAKEGWAQSIELLRGTDLKFAAIVHPSSFRLDRPSEWPSEQEDFRRTIDAARVLGAGCIYTTSGNRGALDWDDAARAYCDAMRPVVDYANSQQIPFLLEPTGTLHADISIVHTLRDTITLADQAGMGICLDIFHCWTNSDLKQSVGGAIRSCGLVQVSDYVLGDRSLPARAVPGDGAIPLERILGWILDAGYAGVFDLELSGPRIESEGTIAAVARAAGWLDRVLGGAPAA